MSEPSTPGEEPEPSRSSEFDPPEDFHEAMERLQEVAEALDGGELPLEEAMDRYREGLELIRYCERRLEDAELLIEEVDDSDARGPRLEEREPPDS